MSIQSTWIGSPNYTAGRGGQRIDHITLHIMAGFLAGTDATFQDTTRGTSATYGIGADGTIHQYVRESNTPWSDSDYLSNQTGISIEHEGGLPQAPCTQACMDASARLCADIARRHGWTRLWHNGTVGNVYLHREIPGSTHTTCPDLAPNGLDVQYVIDKANQILQGDGDMVTQQDIDKIASAVWSYKSQGTRATDRLAGIDRAANNANGILIGLKDKLTRLCDMLLKTKSENGMRGADGKPNSASVWTRLDWLDKRVRALMPNPPDSKPTQTAFRLSDEDVERIARKVKDML